MSNFVSKVAANDRKSKSPLMRFRSTKTTSGNIGQKWGTPLHLALLAKNRHYERVGKNWGPASRILRGGSRPGSEFGRDDVDIVSFRVESHGAGGLLCGDCFRNTKLRRGFLFDHRENSILAAGGKGQSGFLIEGGGVDAFADWRSRKNLAAVGIHYSHHLVVASNKQTAILAIHGEPAGTLAGRERPFRFHFKLVGIDLNEFARVFIVDEDLALGVADRKFGLAAELDRAQNLAVACIDSRRVVAPAVEGEHTLRRGIVENCVRILADFDLLSDRLQCLDIEDGHSVFASIAGEATSQVGSQRHSVHARSIGNVSDVLAGIEIENDHVCAAGNVETARARIRGQVVPSALATYFVGCGNVVSGRSGGQRECRERHRDDRCKPLEFARHTFLLSCGYLGGGPRLPNAFQVTQVN